MQMAFYTKIDDGTTNTGHLLSVDGNDATTGDCSAKHGTRVAQIII